MKTRIIVKKSRGVEEPLDCDVCGLALRDMQDVLSVKRYKKCTDCRTNYSNDSTKDN